VQATGPQPGVDPCTVGTGWEDLMRANLTTAHTRLLRAIRTIIQSDPWFAGWSPLPESGGVSDCAVRSAAPTLVIEEFASEPWASLTFSGTRHSLSIRLRGAQQDVESAYDRLECLLIEPDLDIPGHFLAEIELVESEGEIYSDGSMTLGIQFDALTIEE
jgi:hypothetical protein